MERLTALPKKKEKDDLDDLLKPVQGGKKGKQGTKGAKVSANISTSSKVDDQVAESIDPASKSAPTEPSKSEDVASHDWATEMENMPSSAAGDSMPEEFSRSDVASSNTAPITSKRKQTQQKIILTGGMAGANEALPSAPRAAYEDAIDLSQLPTERPFSIRFKNAPFESTEEDLTKYFVKLLEGATREMGGSVKSGGVIKVTLSNRDGRPSGAGDVELDSRDDLIRLVTYRHRETLRNRKIDLLLPWADRSGDQPRRQGYQRDEGDDRTAGKWRDDRQPQRDRDSDRRSGYAGTTSGDDRDFTSGWRNPGWQDLPRKESDERSGGSSSTDRSRRPGGGTKFTKFQNADSSRPSDVEQVSDWRASMKGPLPGASADEPRGRDERERTRERGEWRSERSGASDERKNWGRDRERDRESSPPGAGASAWRKGPPPDRSEPAASASQPAAERKKLQLAPRSVNATAAQAAELSERSAALFGGAKPVDTRTKEAEIEHRIEQKTRRESAASSEKEPTRTRDDEERKSRSPTPQKRSRTPSPSAPRRASRSSQADRSPSPAEPSHEPQERHRTPSPARSGKSQTGSSKGERVALASPPTSDRLGADGRVRRDKETGEPGLVDRGNRRRSSQAEDEDRQRPASRSDRSPKSRYTERPPREGDSEHRYPDRRRYEESGARPRGGYDSRENDSRSQGESSWRDTNKYKQEPPREQRDKAEPQAQWRRGTSNTEQRGGGGGGGGGGYGSRDRDRDDQRQQYYPSRSSDERYPSRQSDERDRDRDTGYSGHAQPSRDANYWRQGGGRSGEQQRENRNEQQAARGDWRPGRYNEQARQQAPFGRAPIHARDVPERLGPRPSRQLVEDESLAAGAGAGAAKEKKGVSAADISNRFGLLDEDEDAGPGGEEPVSTSVGVVERPASRHSDYNYD